VNGAPVIRDADAAQDADEVGRLWRDYLTWGNDGLESRYGFRLPVDDFVERDLHSIAKFLPPDGRLLLAVQGNRPIGTSALQRIGLETAEIKRMWVDPAHRRAGMGRAMLDHLIAAARAAGYERIRLDSPDFMTSAHALYRSFGFVSIGSYPESEIPDPFKSHWVFMERALS
jgi:ribosomal protein S18 acetylase RimI-like enzyme